MGGGGRVPPAGGYPPPYIWGVGGPRLNRFTRGRTLCQAPHATRPRARMSALCAPRYVRERPRTRAVRAPHTRASARTCRASRTTARMPQLRAVRAENPIAHPLPPDRTADTERRVRALPG